MRSSESNTKSARQLPALEDPATLVHVDFTEHSAHEVVEHYLKDEAEELNKKPCCIIQVITVPKLAQPSASCRRNTAL